MDRESKRGKAAYIFFLFGLGFLETQEIMELSTASMVLIYAISYANRTELLESKEASQCIQIGEDGQRVMSADALMMYASSPSLLNPFFCTFVLPLHQGLSSRVKKDETSAFPRYLLLVLKFILSSYQSSSFASSKEFGLRNLLAEILSLDPFR